MATHNRVHSKRFLFVLWDGGGNVPPQLTLMRRLIERGHEVRVLAPQVLKARLLAVGCQFAPYVHAPEHDSTSPDLDLLRDWEATNPLAAAACVRDRVMAGPSLAFAQDVLEVLAEYPADVVVTDYLLFGAYLGAERVGVPLVACIHHIYPLPDPALPPFGLGFQPARNLPGKVRDALMRRLFRHFYEAALPALNSARATLGLPPLASAFDLFTNAARVLVLTSPAFDFPAAALPANVRYVGAPLEKPPIQGDGQGVWDAEPGQPLIVVSLSTTFQLQEEVLRRLIGTLSQLPVRVLVTVGPALDPGVFDSPANVEVRPYVPHHEVFPHAALVITHGGHGTVLRALACGVPLLCLPMGRDQADVAARVVWRGAGLSLSTNAKPEALRHAVTRLLHESHFRAGARRMAEALAQEEQTLSAVTELEGVVANHPAALQPA